ncbi:MAG: TadE/TadG family type IV pilus assembly protein [Pseudomonadota bacterium]
MSDDAGQVAVIFALSLIPIFAVAGFAIDFQNTLKKKQKVQVIMDSAVLAAARVKQTGASDAEVSASLSAFMNAQLDPMGGGMTCALPRVSVGAATQRITASLSCSQPTSLTRVIGQEKMNFNVGAVAEYGIDKIDVAFMFDVSGSMNSSSRLTNLKAAATDAINILLPVDAAPPLIENTRLSMVTYNTMVNAGVYFEAVTGVPATRTYTHTIGGSGSGPKVTEGDLLDDIVVKLMDADRNEFISLIGNDAVIAIEDWTRDRTDHKITVDVSVPGSSKLNGRFKSIRFNLTGRESKTQTENVVPYALYGDRRGNYNGRNWREGEYSLRIRLYSERRARGRKLYDERIDFEIVRGEGSPPREVEYTLTSTCVWERDGDEKFTDSEPEPESYLAHQQAWFEEDEDHSNGGVWHVGHPNRPDHSWYDGDECRASQPIALTNNRTTLINHINGLTAGGGTAGHLGVAWSWYLVSENWDGVFTGDSAPFSYTEPDSSKVAILMTDGAFNAEIFPGQGRSSAQARNLCDNMKLRGVKVYAVALSAPSSGQDVLSYCASGPDFYFEPESAAELTDAYRKIATSISDLRISG